MRNKFGKTGLFSRKELFFYFLIMILIFVLSFSYYLEWRGMPVQIRPVLFGHVSPIDVKIIWNPVRDADYYEVQISKSMDFLNFSGCYTDNVYCYVDLEESETYFVRISSSGNNNVRLWSFPRMFFTSKIMPSERWMGFS
jgi:hypothetical protein